MSELRDKLGYTESHEWARLDEDGTIAVGITDHAQDELGDLVYVELPAEGTKLSPKEQAGVLESVKAASEIYTPVSGTILEVNKALEDKPELLNQSPYDEGWIFRIQPELPGQEALDALLNREQYAMHCRQK